MTIVRIQHIEIPDHEWEEINARTDINPCQKLDEACWSVNAIITHEELSTYEEFCVEV